MRLVLSVVCLLAILSTPARPALLVQAPQSPSLYEQLGRAYPIAVVVDAFIERLLRNKTTLNANPAIDHARKQVPKQGLKVPRHDARVSSDRRSVQVRGAINEGRTHTPEHHRTAMAGDAGAFKVTLDTFKVPVPEQKELFAIVDSTKADIVVAEK